MSSGESSHIAHITDHAFIGGGARVLFSAARGLAAHHWSSSVICGDDGPLAEDLRAIGVSAEALPIAGKYQFVGFFPRLVARLRRQRPTVVMLYGPVAGCIGGVAARLAGIPCIVYSADYPLYHGDWDLPTRMRSAVVGHIACACASAVWCKSVADIKLYQARKAAQPDKLYLAPNCVAADILQGVQDAAGRGLETGDDVPPPDHHAALRERWGMASSDLILGFVGRLVPEKGVDVLLKAFPTIARNVPSARLLITGKGPERAPLERLARELDIAERVVFTGAQRDIVPYYLISDVIVVPSRYEAFGNVAVEAMACGRPVVASRVGGFVDAIADEECGKLVAPNDSEDLAAAVVWLLQSPGRVREMGMRGRQRALALYTEESLASRLDRIIRDNLARRSAVPPLIP